MNDKSDCLSYPKNLKCADRDWLNQAISKLDNDFRRSSDTHLIKLDLPSLDNIDLYLKDESTHPTGSLKHRLARSLFLHAICNGKIHKDSTIVEASSGSTAISEAYFARLLGLPFIAVVPKTLAQEKVAAIKFYGGSCHYVDRPGEIYNEAQNLASNLNGHYMDQFTFAEQATDWRGNNNIAESIFNQMSGERFAIPDWIVISAGTGGTSATIGRYIRYCPQYSGKTRLCVADPENSVFYDYFKSKDKSLTCDKGSRIEGIGRPRVEPSFIAEVIDSMIKVPDAASIASILWLEKKLGRKCGGSTGTNLYALLQIVDHMRNNNLSGSIVSMICDSGERYLNTYYNEKWVKEHDLDIDSYTDKINQLCMT